MARDYQQEAQAFSVWYVTWEEQIPKAARDDLMRRLERCPKNDEPAPDKRDE